MTKPFKRLEAAFELLLDLVEKGMEYPDAEWKASYKFDVSSDDLRAMYDTHITDQQWKRHCEGMERWIAIGRTLD